MTVRGTIALARMELLLTLRRGESLLVTLGIPLGLLLFFGTVDVLPVDGPTLDFLVPGVLALSVIAEGTVSLGIATAFERQGGVLQRLGVTPLGRSGLLTAKLVVVGTVVVLQTAIVIAAGAALGWRPAGSVPLAAGVLALGVVAFTGLGFVLAGNLRAETTLAAANGLFLVFLLLGGVVVPVAGLPGPLASAAQVLPAEPLTSSLRAALEATSIEARSLAGLSAWAVGASVLALRTFRWS